MATEIRVPTLGESVTEATIGKWFKKPGDAVKADEPLVELETDKVTLEVNAPAAGVLAEITAKDGETVGVGALLGSIAAGGGRPPRLPPAAEGTLPPQPRRLQPPPPAAAPLRAKAAAAGTPLAPSVQPHRRRERRRPRRRVAGTGKDGRVTKGDMLAAIANSGRRPGRGRRALPSQVRAPSPADDAAREERVQA